MALSQEEWFSKLKSWVPSWFWEEEQYNVAIIQSLAKLLSERQEEVEEVVRKTFIDKSSGAYLDLLGDERSIARLSGELAPPYRVRIKKKSLVSQADWISLAGIVNELLIRGVCSVREDFNVGVYANRGHFCNRAELLIDPIKDAFTIVFDRQVHEPYSFVNRDHFSNQDTFVGQAESSLSVFEAVMQAVGDNKAFGALYRIIERTN